jgi:DNA-binding protein H-NS
MDLSKLSIDKLRALIKDAQAEIETRRKADRKQVLADIKQLAEKHGFSLNDLVGGTRGAEGRGRSGKAPKYRHPDDPNKTWGGQGRKPNWVKDWLAAKGSLEDLRVG